MNPLHTSVVAAALVSLAGCGSSAKLQSHSGTTRVTSASTTATTRVDVPDVTVPNVVGKRACDALPVLVKAGLVPQATFAPEIAWVVVSQEPAAGTRVKHGTPAALNLRSAVEPTTPPSDRCVQAIAMSTVPPPPASKG